MSQSTTVLSYRQRPPGGTFRDACCARDVVDLFPVYFIAPVQSTQYLVGILAKTPWPQCSPQHVYSRRILNIGPSCTCVWISAFRLLWTSTGQVTRILISIWLTEPTRNHPSCSKLKVLIWNLWSASLCTASAAQRKPKATSLVSVIALSK